MIIIFIVIYLFIYFCFQYFVFDFHMAPVMLFDKIITLSVRPNFDQYIIQQRI